MILGRVGEVVSLTVVLADGATDKYPQASIYDSVGTPVPLAVLDMDHVDEGLYRAPYTVPSSDSFHVVYIVYNDAGHTEVSAVYTRGDDLIQSDLPESPEVLLSSLAEAQLNIAYDDNTLAFRAAAWIDRAGQSVVDPVSAVISVRDDTHALVFSETSLAPTNGVFIFERIGVSFLDNRVYYVEVVVTDTQGSARTVQSLSTVA